ncbi:carbohydrate ABC transporter permease [Propionibacteriaceae bacterium G1746]|uniref:carbohydrate ABC transporter permease n=1 Tax=Aestuariimicrobium sp. G57 TaxID=3418485 RepID=UPI003C1EBF82
MTTLTPVVPDTGMATPSRKRNLRASLTFDKISLFLVFLGLPLVLYAVFVVSPFFQAIGYSFTDWNGFTDKMNNVGLNNYTKLFQDELFLRAMRNNILLAIVLPLVIVTLSLALATMITVAGRSVGEISGLKGASFYRVVSFFPYTIPAIVVGIMWGQIFDPSAGLVNGVLTRLGFEQFESFAWLGNVKTAMPVTMFIIIWGFIGFYMILFIAAVKGIPSEIYEAARIDGAGRFRTAISITLPLIRENVQTAYIYIGIMALDAYVYMQALNPFGGPDNSTLTMPQYLMTTAFEKSQFGLACAMGVMMGILTGIFAAIVFTVNRLSGGKDQVTMA